MRTPTTKLLAGLGETGRLLSDIYVAGCWDAAPAEDDEQVVDLFHDRFTHGFVCKALHNNGKEESIPNLRCAKTRVS